MVRRFTVAEDYDFLRQKSAQVLFPDEQLENDINALRDFCYDNNNKVYSMAAVQIGIPKRIMFIRHNQEVDARQGDQQDVDLIYINPQVVGRRGQTKYWELSASLQDGDMRFIAHVERPYEIEIEYQDEEGLGHSKTIMGFEATIFLHEYDLMNGILCTDRTDEIRHMSPEQIKSEIRSQYGYDVLVEDGAYIEGEYDKYTAYYDPKGLIQLRQIDHNQNSVLPSSEFEG
ncbi:MAG: peptide deformylase [Christensenellaceae bacterium]|jgi:peptide deformylase|nr:peptide deformylase [Christensenellaceae bacterium]